MYRGNICPYCNGSGETDSQHGGSWSTCYHCNGSGRTSSSNPKPLTTSSNSSSIKNDQVDGIIYSVSLLDISRKESYREIYRFNTTDYLAGRFLNEEDIFKHLTQQVVWKYIDANSSPAFSRILQNKWAATLNILLDSGMVLEKKKTIGKEQC